MVFLAHIKKDLPEWPDDLIEQWLLYFANEPDCGGRLRSRLVPAVGPGFSVESRCRGGSK
jgi:hypothetical protein